jgi:hypothetical protein
MLANNATDCPCVMSKMSVRVRENKPAGAYKNTGNCHYVLPKKSVRVRKNKPADAYKYTVSATTYGPRCMSG